MKRLWPSFFPNTDGIIFVVDAQDAERDVKMLNALGEHLTLESVPLMLIINSSSVDTSVYSRANMGNRPVKVVHVDLMNSFQKHKSLMDWFR
jgi:GTPase SAR1 family protein